MTMKIQKSTLTVDGKRVHVSMPFAKVDESKRLVSGWATLDNLDTQGDVVLAEASAKAFARARGNIREMHQPLAVGRMVDFREDEFFHRDPVTKKGKFYRGIFVTARVSEGAEDTWKKVLDGTLTGFSIGGEIKEASNEFVKDAGRTVRFIKDYDLTELSLVDNPANQLSNFESFAKVLSMETQENGSVTAKGMAVDTKIENVFICMKHDEEVVLVKDVEYANCPECEAKMETAGWFESGADRAEKVNGIVTKFLGPSEQEAAPISDEGGVTVFKKNSNNEEETAKEVGVVNPGETHSDGEPIEDSEQVSVPLDAEEEAEATAEGESPEEVEGDEDSDAEISKRFDALQVAVKKSIDESREETLRKVSDLAKQVEDATTKFSELEGKISQFGENIEAQKARLAALEGSLEKMNRSAALKKSAGLEPAEPIVQNKNFWGGAFSD